MKYFRVIALSAGFSSGRLSLSADQFASRRHALVPTKEKGVFRILQPVQFKRGEEIGFDGEVNKILLQDLSPVEANPKTVEGTEGKGKPGRHPKAVEGA
ncbi:MAG: hypothetical protein M0Z38_06765 [Deltaproteobacteria bacterium]|nr:hypothetical protein [Deltaproteobacteria bacterium]